MNLKVAHLVSVQFGIFVGVVSCLVASRFEFGKPRSAAELRVPVPGHVAGLDRLSQPESQRDYMDNSAEAESTDAAAERPAPALPNEYSPEAAERYRALAEKLYYEQIAPRRTVTYGPASNSNAAAAPTYTEMVQEPAVVEEPAPQTVAYVQPVEVLVYPQPIQFFGFSRPRPRRIVNRCEPAPHRETLGSNPHRGAGREGTHVSGSPKLGTPGFPGAVHHRNAGGPSCPSRDGFAQRGKR